MQPVNRSRPPIRRRNKNLFLRRFFLVLVIAAVLVGAFFLIKLLFFPSAPSNDDPSSALESSSAAPSAADSSAPPPSEAEPSRAPVSTPEEAGKTPPPIGDDGSDGYLSSGIYIWNSKAFELFYGGTDTAEEYAAAISSYRDKLGGDIQVYNMVVPNHSEFGLPERLRDAQGCSSQRETTTAVYQSYTSDVTPVDIYDALNLHNDEYLYFNTDMHWTQLGAYYAYAKFCEVAQAETTPLEGMAKSTIEDFKGYLYTATEESALAENPDHIDVYDVPGDFTVKLLPIDGEEFTDVDSINSPYEESFYSVFAWGDNPCLQIANQSVTNGRKLLFLKDSYGNAMVSFLAASFEEVHVVDFRFFEGSLPAYCEEQGITDVLFFNSTMTAHNPNQVETMDTLFE